jgi:cell volume regulation protein A
MFVVDKIILLSAILILIGVISSKLSARLGLPVLVLFLLVGMLAGESGIGGIAFDNPTAAHALGSLALALILFDGGLQTSIASIRVVWKPSAILATVGVLITAAITGLAAAYVLNLPLLEGLLVGAIVGSTDAAAVFSLLRNAGIYINTRLKSILEIESASNDPMAIFLTVGLLEVITNDMPLGLGLLQLFALQMGIGALVGISTGWFAVRMINRINFLASGLYPVTIVAFGLLAFGVAANLNGSGFLAIFLAGVFIGNSRFAFQRSTLLFHDGLAWLSQITMFVVLGLLVSPTELLDVWVEGLIISCVLMFIARPFIVVPVLKLFNFNAREITLVSWVGLRGSVPIILAIFPLMYGLPNAALIFNVVFFVVLISATLQGSTLPLSARKLGLSEPAPAAPAATLEITALNDINADIVEYTLGEHSRAAGQLLARMALPDSTVVAMITRQNMVIPPRGSTTLQKGDHLFVVMRPDTRAHVDFVFSDKEEVSPEEMPAPEVALRGSTTIDDIRRCYGLQLPGAGYLTLADVIRAQENQPTEGTTVTIEHFTLVVQSMIGNRIATVLLQCATDADSVS